MEATMHKLFVVIVTLSLSVPDLLIPRLSYAQNALCFNIPGITNCIDGRFREFWEQNGGLSVFGYPITSAADEVNSDTEQTYRTQWFERNRFELHPENTRPYDVLLGRLGNDELRRHGRDWRTFPDRKSTR